MQLLTINMVKAAFFYVLCIKLVTSKVILNIESINKIIIISITKKNFKNFKTFLTAN